MYYRKVSKNTANNPVAQACARAKLHSVLRDQKIRLYMLDKGEPCEDLMEGVGVMLGVVGYAAVLQKLSGPDVNKVRGGHSACQQLVLAGKYDPLHTVAIAAAIDSAEALNKLIKAEFLNMSLRKLKVFQ